MKMMKRLSAILIAVLLMVSMMVVPAIAAEPTTYTITINNTAEGHTYKAYQIFTGSLSETGVLSDVKWGDGVDAAELLAALKENANFEKDGTNQFAGCADAVAVSKVLNGWAYNDTPVKNFADVVGAHLLETDPQKTSQYSSENKEYTISGLAAGYYLIKDTAVTGTDGYTDYLLAVVKNTDISPKVSTPTLTKTVNNVVGGTYQDGMDVQIGDTVYFKLETKLPSLYKDYKQYYCSFTDTLPDGLTFNQLEEVYILHGTGSTTSVAANEYSASTSNDILTVTFNNLKGSHSTLVMNDTIVIKYSAKVESVNVTGKGGASNYGNVNSVTMTFSNDPNQEAQANVNDIHTGSVTADASVYTYQIDVTKVDSTSGDALGGAQFYLFRNVVEQSSDDAQVSTAADETVPYYAIVDPSGVVKGWTKDKNNATLLESSSAEGTKGQFSVKGLDAVSYWLEEVKAPDGYNMIEDPILVTISATITDGDLKSLGAVADGTSATGTVSDGVVKFNIKNTAGTTLPETGGIGTTIFYAVGGVLVIGALSLLIVRKRTTAK